MRLDCRLREARGKRKLAEIAAASGVQYPYLSQVEKGRMLPRDEWIAPMERAYGIAFDAWYSPRTLLALVEDEAA